MVAIRYAGQATVQRDGLKLRIDDFPTEEEGESGFPLAEYRETVEYLSRKQQEERFLAQEDEQVLLALYRRLPELQQQVTPPYGTRIDLPREERIPPEARRIAGRVYEIEVPVE